MRGRVPAEDFQCFAFAFDTGVYASDIQLSYTMKERRLLVSHNEAGLLEITCPHVEMIRGRWALSGESFH